MKRHAKQTTAEMFEAKIAAARTELVEATAEVVKAKTVVMQRQAVVERKVTILAALLTERNRILGRE